MARIVDGWGEPGLTAAERVFGWNTLELLAFGCGDPARPVGAIPGVARATLQLRFVVGTDVSHVDEVIAANPDKVEQAKAKPSLAGWFVGQVMKATGGKANPQAVNELLKSRLGL